MKYVLCSILQVSSNLQVLLASGFLFPWEIFLGAMSPSMVVLRGENKHTEAEALMPLAYRGNQHNYDCTFTMERIEDNSTAQRN